MNLTENEKIFLRELQPEFNGIETISDGKDFCRECSLGSRKARGVLSTLIQKQVLSYSGNLPENKNCYNPIYKSKNYEEAVKEI